MVAISTNYGISFKATSQLPNTTKTAQTTAPNEHQKKMSNSMKAGIGLGALATIALAGLIIKKKMPIKINSKELFETTFGKIEEVKGELGFNDLIGYIKSEVHKRPECKQTHLIRLTKDGLSEVSKKSNIQISENLFKDKEALILRLSDKNSNELFTKPIIADTLDEKTKALFKDNWIVELT